MEACEAEGLGVGACEAEGLWAVLGSAVGAGAEGAAASEGDRAAESCAAGSSDDEQAAGSELAEVTLGVLGA